MHPVLNVAVEAAHAAANIMRRQMQHVDAIRAYEGRRKATAPWLFNDLEKF